MGCNIAFIGGGALRTLGVIGDWARQGEVAAESRITVMDLNAERVALITALARQMPELAGLDIAIHGATALDEALDGADFVYNVVRVGGVEALARDLRIGAAYGIPGADDFGPSGAMLALRGIPVVLRLAEAMSRRCPQAWLLNFTNPVPFLVRAVADFTDIRVIGLCGGDMNQRYDIPTLLGWTSPTPDPDFSWRGVGIDHFCWSTELTYRGEDFYPALFAAIPTLDRTALPYYCRMELEVLETYGQWLSCPEHCFHWTHKEEMLQRLRDNLAGERHGLPAGTAWQSDFERQLAALTRQELGAEYWEYPPLSSVKPVPHLTAVGVEVMRAIVTDSGAELMVNVRAPGAVDNLPDDGIVLLTCAVHRDGPRPLRFSPGVPPAIAPLTRQLLDYQGALAHAAVHGTRRELEAALLMDPYQRDIPILRTMLDELLAANAGMISPTLHEIV